MIGPQELFSLHQMNKKKRIQQLEERVDKSIKDLSNRPTIQNKLEVFLGENVPSDEAYVVLSSYKEVGWDVMLEERKIDDDGVEHQHGKMFMVFNISNLKANVGFAGESP